MIARLSIVAVVAAMSMCGTSAYALTQKECSDKYAAAKEAKTLNGRSWNAFRKDECGSEAATPASTKETEKKTAPTKETEKKTTAKTEPTPTPTGNAVFPTAISPKYSKESAGKARRQTCLDQYNVNKPNNANGGLVWIQKGGGDHHECNNRLKG